MQAVSSAVMRELDQRAINEAGIPGELLMERAGVGLADAVERRLDARTPALNRAGVILLIAGSGNNGGDVFTAARHLHERGHQVEVWLAADTAKVKGDAAFHLERLRQCGIEPTVMPKAEQWQPGNIPKCQHALIVDGLLGTGINGAARGVMAAAIDFINSGRHKALIAAVDVPSGLNADDGTTPGPTVQADFTVTMGLPKTGLLQPAALEFVGNLEVVDIGIPEEFLPVPADSPELMELITPCCLTDMLHRRSRSAHKGDYGRLLIIAGARGYAGAAMLAARAALRSGAGLVSLLTPQSVRAEIAANVPGAMVHGIPENSAGAMTGLPDEWQKKLSAFNAILAGPGLTAGDDTLTLIRTLINRCGCPLLLDADALNALAMHAHQTGALTDWQAARRQTNAAPIVITPHPGEAARLLATTSADIQSDRFKAAHTLMERTGAITVLKGAGTLVAAPGRPLLVNLTGNPGMACGGSGDVLAGLMAGLLARNIPAATAVAAAVYIHGRAGDHAAARHTENGMTANDIINCLPQAWAELTPR